mmetsp:Transcript_41570/g.70111  ORF Transcript_41570/g.70111 Transcript_41570/m.70111 type:complete len:733 (-) Transcript_41570:1100-3298(-)
MGELHVGAVTGPHILAEGKALHDLGDHALDLLLVAEVRVDVVEQDLVDGVALPGAQVQLRRHVVVHQPEVARGLLLPLEHLRVLPGAVGLCHGGQDDTLVERVLGSLHLLHDLLQVLHGRQSFRHQPHAGLRHPVPHLLLLHEVRLGEGHALRERLGHRAGVLAVQHVGHHEPARVHVGDQLAVQQHVPRGVGHGLQVELELVQRHRVVHQVALVLLVQVQQQPLQPVELLGDHVRALLAQADLLHRLLVKQTGLRAREHPGDVVAAEQVLQFGEHAARLEAAADELDHLLGAVRHEVQAVLRLDGRRLVDQRGHRGRTPAVPVQRVEDPQDLLRDLALRLVHIHAIQGREGAVMLQQGLLHHHEIADGAEELRRGDGLRLLAGLVPAPGPRRQLEHVIDLQHQHAPHGQAVAGAHVVHQPGALQRRDVLDDQPGLLRLPHHAHLFLQLVQRPQVHAQVDELEVIPLADGSGLGGLPRGRGAYEQHDKLSQAVRVGVVRVQRIRCRLQMLLQCRAALLRRPLRQLSLPVLRGAAWLRVRPAEARHVRDGVHGLVRREVLLQIGLHRAHPRQRIELLARERQGGRRRTLGASARRPGGLALHERHLLLGWRLPRGGLLLRQRLLLRGLRGLLPLRAVVQLRAEEGDLLRVVDVLPHWGLGLDGLVRRPVAGLRGPALRHGGLGGLRRRLWQWLLLRGHGPHLGGLLLQGLVPLRKLWRLLLLLLRLRRRLLML